MLDKLAEVEKRYTQLEGLMSDPSLPGKTREYSKIAKERADLEELVTAYRDWKKTEQEIEANKELLGDSDEALFAAELARMYTRYAENRGWRIEIMSSNPTGLGGMKEIILSVEGKGAYSR